MLQDVFTLLLMYRGRAVNIEAEQLIHLQASMHPLD